MRWDYLYRYYDRYHTNGFKRLLNDGFNCQNTMINYLPSYTAAGHACIYTGSVPSINGIAGNNWIDNQTGQNCYCVDDASLVSSDNVLPAMSPANLLTTTITDELRLATNFKSRVYGIAIKDRGAILPAGHTGAAYWYNDRSGEFVTSAYYGKQAAAPGWLKAFNKRNLADSLTRDNWELMHKPEYYDQSTQDLTAYELPFKGENAAVFPHQIKSMSIQDRLSIIKSIPAGNALTLEMARACIEGADGGKLGKGDNTDFLCVSLSATDYAGHQFGPNSVEVEDMYLRLDIQIASFLNYLDRTVGKGNYLLFLTADHGAAHNPQYLKDRGIPAGTWLSIANDLNSHLKETFITDSPIVKGIVNNQLYLNESLLSFDKNIRDQVKANARDWLLNVMGQKYQVPVSYVLDVEDLNKTPVPEPIRTMAINGYNRNRSGSMLIILNPGWFESERTTGTTHGAWNPYDTHIPLLWYGWHIRKGETYEQVNMTDIAPTLAGLLHIQQPNGCIGKPIVRILDCCRRR
jgi:predicted AlkP superfamily pyrophosphatase or phosphodiesterase